MTHKERMLLAMRGEMPDVLPYAPRFDLWYKANKYKGTLPKEFREKSPEDIARSEGWALHRVVPELLDVEREEDNLYRALGLYSLKECGYEIRFSKNVMVKAERSEASLKVEYQTSRGVITTKETLTEEMRQAGATITWIEERAIKRKEDYEILAHLFDEVQVVPSYERYRKWQGEVGEEGVAVMMGSFSASPMQHIQRDLLDATRFFYEYKDNEREMRLLAESLEKLYNQILFTVSNSPAEVVLWGANYDEMITYPPFFEREILPWLKKASEVLSRSGKLLLCHCDGENEGLMDLIKRSGIKVAEAVCPSPMTKVPIERYYHEWRGSLTIWGGIPQSLLLPSTASLEDFKGYLDHFFRAISPGDSFIVGIADTTPPDAHFDRLRILADKIQEQGPLPLKKALTAPSCRPQGEVPKTAPDQATTEDHLEGVRKAVLEGDHLGIIEKVRELLAQGVPAKEILQEGMIKAMDLIGARFKTGEVFIPEVLLSARAMNEALKVLEPHLASERVIGGGKILIGTVHGDLHDIGKNMVVTMLKGVGFEVKDLGINVSAERFVSEVESYAPDILGLSALLTTTMPEMAKVIRKLEEKGLRKKVKVIVGGAPVNEKYAREIGADGYGRDAGEAVEVAKRLLQIA